MPLVVLLLILMFINVKIHYSPSPKVVGRDTVNIDLLKQLRGLKHAVSKNADIDMQRLYPEGYLFFNALYGLAWCNFIETVDEESEYFEEGYTEVQKAWNKIDGDDARAKFYKDLPLSYGAYYVGWSTYLLGKKLSIEKPGTRDSVDVEHFRRQCDQIATAIGKKTYPESYSSGAWPADVVLCVASLALHDEMFPEQYSAAIQRWMASVKTRLDPMGLIPHEVNIKNGMPAENARGSSQSLMLIFLRDIDEGFADQQFKIYRSNFLENRFGLCGIREYTKGSSGHGDVDSGPVIFDMGAAATIVGMNTLRLFDEFESAKSMRNSVEVFGISTSNAEFKQYLFGKLPMADAFIAWGDSLDPTTKSEGHGFIVFHLYSALGASLIVLILWIFWLRHVGKG